MTLDVSSPRILWLASALLAAWGCGGRDRMVTVSGEAVFSDGSPVQGGVVDFNPLTDIGRPSRAAIGLDGRFTLRSGALSGTRPGRYGVAVVTAPTDPGISGHRHEIRRVDPRFSRFDTSGIVVEVVAGKPNVIRIVVEAAPSGSGFSGR